MGTITLRTVDSSYFEREAGAARLNDHWDSWFQYAPLADGRSYVRGFDMGEFLIAADGSTVVCHREPGMSYESFQVYLLGQALSFALLKRGFEPLHATAVVVDGRAVAFLGASGVGKSTLAAAFVRSGYRVLTDDVLVVQETGGRMMAHPGPTRLKLFSSTARRLAADVTGAVQMNGVTTKLVIPLNDAHVHAGAVPLGAIYDVALPAGKPGSQKLALTPLSRRHAAMALVRSGFNQRYVNRDRLSRQFAASVAVAEQIPVKTLSYPRVLKSLPQVVQAVAQDAQSQRRTELTAT